MDMQKELYRQLELDYSLPEGSMPLRENLFVKKRYLEGRRIYKNDNCLLQVLSVDGCAVFASSDDELLAWCRERFGSTYGAWMCEVDKLFLLNEKLKESGHFVADAHSFYIPGPDPFRAADRELPVGFTVRWFEREEMQPFFGDKRFSNAVTGSDLVLDMIAVAGVYEDRITAMAGVSADSPTAWQIGIDVLPEYRQRGLGTILTALLGREVVRRGYLPFYGTGESHIQSRRVAYGAGFRPAWWELYTKKMPEGDK